MVSIMDDDIDINYEMKDVSEIGVTISREILLGPAQALLTKVHNR